MSYRVPHTSLHNPQIANSVDLKNIYSAKYLWAAYIASRGSQDPAGPAKSSKAQVKGELRMLARNNTALTQLALVMLGDKDRGPNSGQVKQVKGALRSVIRDILSGKLPLNTVLAENGSVSAEQGKNVLPDGVNGGYDPRTRTILLSRSVVSRGGAELLKAMREETGEVLSGAVIESLGGKKKAAQLGIQLRGDVGDRVETLLQLSYGKSGNDVLKDKVPSDLYRRVPLGSPRSDDQGQAVVNGKVIDGVRFQTGKKVDGQGLLNGFALKGLKYASNGLALSAGDAANVVISLNGGPITGKQLDVLLKSGAVNINKAAGTWSLNKTSFPKDAGWRVVYHALVSKSLTQTQKISFLNALGISKNELEYLDKRFGDGNGITESSDIGAVNNVTQTKEGDLAISSRQTVPGISKKALIISLIAVATNSKRKLFDVKTEQLIDLETISDSKRPKPAPRFRTDQRSGDIAVTVFNDKNNNGVQDRGESGIAGSKVGIDENADGRVGRGDVAAYTDENGRAIFKKAIPGAYSVAIENAGALAPDSAASKSSRLKRPDGTVVQGSGTRVFLIDHPVNTGLPAFKAAKITTIGSSGQRRSEHGDLMASIIVGQHGYAPKTRLFAYGMYSFTDMINGLKETHRYAQKNPGIPVIVNLSQSVRTTALSPEQKQEFTTLGRELEKSGVIVVISEGNKDNRLRHSENALLSFPNAILVSQSGLGGIKPNAMFDPAINTIAVRSDLGFRVAAPSSEIAWTNAGTSATAAYISANLAKIQEYAKHNYGRMLKPQEIKLLLNKSGKLRTNGNGDGVWRKNGQFREFNLGNLKRAVDAYLGKKSINIVTVNPDTTSHLGVATRTS